jgi:hypothetical protein
METPVDPASAENQLNACLVTFDLNRPHQNYEQLNEQLRTLPSAVRYQQSSWIVRWPGTALQLRLFLQNFIDPDDKLMVVKISSAAWLDYKTTTAMIANGYPVIAA